MNPARWTAIVIAAAALMSGAGCVFGWGQGAGGSGSATTVMSGPEARQTLTRARELAYAGTKAKRERAVRLADSVIQHCGVHRYVWEAFRVKAVALAEAEAHAGAQATAAEGVRAILTLHPGPLDGEPLTALKMLLPVYITNCTQAGAHKEGVAALEKWQKVALSRYPPDPLLFRDQSEGLRLEFKLLREMIEQHAAAREPESQIKSLVLTYVRLYNTNSQQELAALFGEEKDWPPAVRRIFASKQQADSTTRLLHLASAVKLQVPHETQSASSLSGEAICDMMATSAAGWARLTEGVRFSLVRNSEGVWRIKDISGHP